MKYYRAVKNRLGVSPEPLINMPGPGLTPELLILRADGYPHLSKPFLFMPAHSIITGGMNKFLQQRAVRFLPARTLSPKVTPARHKLCLLARYFPGFQVAQATVYRYLKGRQHRPEYPPLGVIRAHNFMFITV